ncbi:hypothetical protein B9Z55_002836 [Caenorhabditis nigoni]|uniref:Sdz-33 F-box domain-containing protein n=1 Tax=Caenorhabditis nigoni TaxID=1611254 RepID=A0A2G5VMC4_9PELO|nr:hypothetical protein B9Z55_002836 [Caenorhabditis nigoni]
MDQNPLKIAKKWIFLKVFKIIDITQMTEHICEVFHSPICEMEIMEESLIEWIIKFQPIIQHVCIRENAITSVESLDRILKNLEVTERFRSDYNACFQYKEPIPSRCITIHNSYWLTLNSILNGNNSIIVLYDSKLTPTDINTVLKEWQSGLKLRNLEFMAIEVFTLLNINRYSDEVLNNLPNIVENNGRPMTVTIHDDDIYTLPQGPPVHNITRSDGMILSIFRHDDVIEDLSKVHLLSSPITLYFFLPVSILWSIIFGTAIEGWTAGGRVLEFQRLQPSIPIDTGVCIPYHTWWGDIKFDNVSFSYPTRPGHNVFENLTFSIPAGQIVALCGPSGEGKSTITHVGIFAITQLKIIQFSLLSKRSKTIAKSIRWNPIDIRWNPIDMHLNPINIRWNHFNIRWNPIDIRWSSQEICFKLSTDPGLEYIIHYEKKYKFIPIHCPWEYPHFQSTLNGPNALHFLYLKDNGIEDITQMMEHICEVFRSPIREMHIIEQSLIEWIIKFQPIIRHVRIHKDVILSVESLDRILKNLKVTERFRSDYHAHFQYKEPIPSRCIKIYNSHWFTLTSILSGNNSIIFLYDSKLTPTDINTILKEWQLGFKLRNLEFMAIEVFTLLNIHRYSDEVLNNLPNRVENNGRPMTVKIHDDNIWTLPQGPPVHNIIRSDGMILSIFRQDDVIAGLEWIIHYEKKKKFFPIHCPWKYPYYQSYLLGPNALHYLYLTDNGIEDITEMMEHICEVFRSPICEMHIFEESLIEWIIKFQPIIRHVCICMEVIPSVETLDRILTNLEVTESFWFPYNAYFQYKEPIPSRCITIDNSYWLTLPSILNGNNSIIFLHDSKLTPTDINTILKEWQLGFKLRNLEFMAIEVFTLLDIHRYSNEVLNNLPNIVENNGRPMTVQIEDDDIWTLPEGPPVHNIIRSDGMILSIFRHDDVIEDEKIRIFWELQVWSQQT